MSPAPDGSADRPTRIASYERRITGSLAGVWENVHDWEHLPWLHSDSFRSIACLDSGDWGWRARVGLPPAGAAAAAGGEIEIELRLRDGEQAYDVTTLEGPGTGSIVATRLAALDAENTGVEVGFHIPGIGNDAADAVGAGFVALYTRLWDEDQAMIVARAEGEARILAPIRETLQLNLGARSELTLPLTFEIGGRRFHLDETDGALQAHAAVCPHRLGPLPAEADEEGCLRCPWHGYRFDARSGQSVDGRGLRLAASPSIAVSSEGQVTATLLPPTRRGGAS